MNTERQILFPKHKKHSENINPAGAGVLRRCVEHLRAARVARGGTGAGAGGDLSRAGTQVERRLHGLQGGAGKRQNNRVETAAEA